MTRRSPRSYLYVPGDRPEWLHGATTSGADAIVVDLEDSVVIERKAAAKTDLADWLASDPEVSCEIWARINPSSAPAELGAIASARLSGVFVPKATPSSVEEVARLLDGREEALGLTGDSFGIVPLVETAEALVCVTALAASPRVVRLGIGEVDLAAELGVRIAPMSTELAAMRLQVVIASAARSLTAPIGPTSLDFRDLDQLRETTGRLADAGFRARSAIHPAQIPVINDVFTPSQAEVEQARRLLSSLDDSAALGRAVVVDEGGRMVDAAVVRSARDVIARTNRPEAG